MTLKITELNRQHPAPCSHYEIVVNDNGVTRSRVLSLNEIEELFAAFPGGSRGALVLAWALDRRNRGASLAQLQNVEIESVIS